MINNCRGLDLTNYTGWLCGKILAELGCEVIKIEKPGGDPGRRFGPFYGNSLDPERSLLWFAYNTSKKSITLNIESVDGREMFKNLVKDADFVIESFPPGYLDKLGIGYAALSEINPRIILTSITPFGQDGPYRDFKAAHIVLLALSGLLYITGDADRPPVQVGFPLVYSQASGQAAAATMIAYYFRERTGEGQHVDVSMQQCGVMWPLNVHAIYQMEKKNLHRSGQFREGRTMTGAMVRYIWQCKDGYVTMSIGGGPAYAKSLESLVKWMDSEGMATDFLKSRNWGTFDMAVITPGEVSQVEKALANFFKAFTKKELFAGAVARQIILFPVSSLKDIAEDPQLQARGYWSDIPHDELGLTLRYPACFAKTSTFPCRIRHRAPLIGEHNEEIYGKELSLSHEQLSTLRQASII